MPLDNTASIKDIITSLQNLEGINAKAELASVIGSPVTDEDTMSTMVNQIQTSKNELAGKIGEGTEGTEPLQSLIDKLIVGVKYASGMIVSSSSGIIFQYAGSTASSTDPFVEWSDPPFVPKKIIISGRSYNTNTRSRTIYEEIDHIYPKTVKMSMYSDTSQNTTTYNYKGDVLGAIVSSQKIRLPVFSPNIEYIWEMWG